MSTTGSETERALSAQAREFLAARYPPERVASIADGEGFPRAAWREVVELGWVSISVPEPAGGSGLGLAEEAALAEELGRALFPGPFLSTVVMALPALARIPELLEEVVAGRDVATMAWAGPDGAFGLDRFPVGVGRGSDRHHLYGSTWFVPDLMIADVAVVAGRGPGGPGLWAVRLEGANDSRQDLPSIDPTRRLGALVLEGAHGTLLAEGDEAVALLVAIRDRTWVALAAESAGVASRALELAVEHARSRVQFGRPIGAFQAVSQPLASAYAEVEEARSLWMWASAGVAAGGPDGSRAAAAAKAFASSAAVGTCERAIQTLGGMGFTWEHPLHRLYRRAEGNETLMGRPAELRARVAASLLDEPGHPEGGG